jgi:hypothetical protein
MVRGIPHLWQGGCRLSPLPGLQLLHRWIPPASQRHTDALQHQVVNFDPFFEGNLAQGLVDGFWQVDARMNDGWPLSLLPGRAGRAGASPGSHRAASSHGSPATFLLGLRAIVSWTG